MTAAASLRALLHGVIDYAGLFPPAKLPMPDAARRFAGYRTSADAWALGRFVVPAARLGELAAARASVGSAGDPSPWPVSALLAGDGLADAALAAAHANRDGIAVDSVECKIPGVRDGGTLGAPLRRILQALPRGTALFVEIPPDGDVEAMVAAVGAAGARAKIRSGGITADLFPPSTAVAQFLAACVRQGVAFKATAGLHHPIRARYRLTYEPDAPVGTMFGFLNVLLAAAFLRDGASEEEARAIVECERAADFRFDDGGVSWRERCVSTAQLRDVRGALALSFGSCSFEEPVEDLRRLALL